MDFQAHDAGISKFDFNDDRELVATVSHVLFSVTQLFETEPCGAFRFLDATKISMDGSSQPLALRS